MACVMMARRKTRGGREGAKIWKCIEKQSWPMAETQNVGRKRQREYARRGQLAAQTKLRDNEVENAQESACPA
jgi:hypothetical protein